MRKKLETPIINQDAEQFAFSTDYALYDYSRFSFTQSLYGTYPWVQFFNATDPSDYLTINRFPLTVLELSRSNPLHSNILAIKDRLVIGQGLYNKKGLITKSCNSFGESLNDIFYKIASDYNMFNGYYLKVIWSKDGNSISDIRHMDFTKMRSGKIGQFHETIDDGQTAIRKLKANTNTLNGDLANSVQPASGDFMRALGNRGIVLGNLYNIYEDKVNEYYYCTDWMQGGRALSNVIRFPAFDLNNRKGEQVVFVRKYQAGQDYYPIPDYVSVFKQIELSNNLANHFLNVVKNKFIPSVIVHYPVGTNPSLKVKKDIEQAFKSGLQGKNGGGVVHLFEDQNGQGSIEFLNQSADNEKQQREILDQIQQQIIPGYMECPLHLYYPKVELVLKMMLHLVMSNSEFQKLNQDNVL